MGSVDDALGYAKVAQQMAGQALLSAQAQGLIFESLIATLRDLNILSRDALEHVFLKSAAFIDDTEHATDEIRQFARTMREAVVNVAAGFDVKIPPPGQIELPTRH